MQAFNLKQSCLKKVYLSLNIFLKMLYPSDFEHKISFHSVRNILKDRCISLLGKERMDAMSFSSDYMFIQQQIALTDELRSLIHESTEPLPIGNFYDMRTALQRIQIEGLFLDELELFELRKALDAVRSLVHFISNQSVEFFPNLHELIQDIPVFQEIIREIDAILDKYGKIKDHASPELSRIRKDMQRTQGSVSRALQQILRQAQTDGYVDKDASPSMRDGRLVIPISPSFKRKISGIVHDESATGKTVFIEPSQVVEANNRIRELEGEERREIVRILTNFTIYIRPFYDEIIDSQYFLGEIDFLCAKALFADQIQAIKPQIEDKCMVDWKKAKHPLLYLSLQKQQKDVVPLDIVLNDNQRIILISGPNAGGKSVCLKTVVLLQYMLQCGLLIPLHESSQCGIFERLFIDIGDEQSIENDLSTYSSHLLNMKFFIKNSNPKTLLLIDEFGSGTEPMIGGALAEATLARFNANRAFGVITTHYTNLKHYAEATEGIANGAMLYDRHHLQPLFVLSIGNPGSSFAVEIARKIGLPEDLIQEAAEKVGAEHLDYDKHLQDIVRDKRYWEKKRQQIRLKEKRLEETLEKYETEMSDINRQRKEISRKAKEEAERLLLEANARIENTIRTIKEHQADKEKTKEIRQELKEFRESISVKKLKVKSEKKVVKATSSPKIQEIVVGAQVRMVGQTAVGVVLELQNKQAVIAFGNLKSTVKINQLEWVSNPTKTKKQKPTTLNLVEDVREKKLQFKSEIDVRGMRGEEALQAVMYFIDDAQMVGVESIRILHGTGTGILRQLIRQYLSTLPNISHYHDEHIQMGGAGITVVEF